MINRAASTGMPPTTMAVLMLLVFTVSTALSRIPPQMVFALNL